MIDWKHTQMALGVVADGDPGRKTFGALFAKLGAKADVADEYGLAAAKVLRPAGLIDSALRFRHFLAQCGHESDGWRATEEYASGAAYEGRDDLGNTQPGDGKRYKGRGPIQITGRANYRLYGGLLGIDIERHPEVASVPSVGFQLAVLYWTKKGLNAYADQNDIETITRRINGGLNGFADRQTRFANLGGLIRE